MDIKEYNNKLNSASELFKALSHPTRFCIVCKLLLHPLNVSQMQQCLDVTQANVSQHLSILKSKGIIVGERKANEIYYSLANNNVKELVKVFFEENEIPDK